MAKVLNNLYAHKNAIRFDKFYGLVLNEAEKGFITNIMIAYKML